MTWLLRYQIGHYVANSIWILPSLGILAAIALAPLARRDPKVEEMMVVEPLHGGLHGWGTCRFSLH